MSHQPSDQPVAAILAGGRGSRIGGDKALAALGARPLIGYVLSAVRDAGLRPVIVAKRETRLPPLDADILIEPDEPHHPLCGVVAALSAHPALVAVPCDMPFLPPALLTALAHCHEDVAVGVADGRLQPFPALYRSTALPTLELVLAAQGSIRSALSSLTPTFVDARPFGDPERTYLAVNSPADLQRAEALLQA